ncbi:hypothetical protein D3C71_1945860 [compost metagenome]
MGAHAVCGEKLVVDAVQRDTVTSDIDRLRFIVAQLLRRGDLDPIHGLHPVVERFEIDIQ